MWVVFVSMKLRSGRIPCPLSGTVLTKPDLALCPQLVKADISSKKANSRFDPEPT